MNLGPEGDSIALKLLKNAIQGDNIYKSSVALRIARVNHACKPNGSIIYDETARVAILYSLKDILPGEEITVCYYYRFFTILSDLSLSGSLVPPPDSSIEMQLSCLKTVMASVHGVTCPSDCFCYDPAILALVREGKKIEPTIVKLSNENKIEEALAAGEKVIDILRRLNVSWQAIGLVNYNLFCIAVRKSDTLPRAKEYIQSAVDIYRKICPYSEKLTKTFEKWLQFP